MKKMIFSLMATVLFIISCNSQNEKYYTSNFKFKDRTELVSLLDRVITETDISDYKNSNNRGISNIKLEIADNQLIYTPTDSNVSTENESTAACPPGFTDHGLFKDENKIRSLVAEIAAPVQNCCPKVTIILDRTAFGVRICSKLEN
jgi:hypothetical protein